MRPLKLRFEFRPKLNNIQRLMARVFRCSLILTCDICYIVLVISVRKLGKAKERKGGNSYWQNVAGRYTHVHVHCLTLQ